MTPFWVVAVLTMFCPHVGYSPCWRPLDEAIYPTKEKCLTARDRAKSEMVLLLGLPEHRYATAQCRPKEQLQDYKDPGQLLWLRDLE